MKEIFKKSGESEEKDKMIDAYCEKFKHLKIDFEKVKEIKKELVDMLKTETVNTKKAYYMRGNFLISLNP